jgi:hypothetical protein
VLTTVKIAEEEGLIARVWDCSGEETTAIVDLGGLCPGSGVGKAWSTDLLERDRDPIVVRHGKVTLPLRARGIATARVMFAGDE